MMTREDDDSGRLVAGERRRFSHNRSPATSHSGGACGQGLRRLSLLRLPCCNCALVGLTRCAHFEGARS